VALAGKRIVPGLRGLSGGPLDDSVAAEQEPAAFPEPPENGSPR
jgi:urease subunit beta